MQAEYELEEEVKDTQTRDKDKDKKTLRVYVNFKNPGAPHYYIRPEAAYSLGLITYEKFAKYSIINDFHPLPYPILQETAKELEIEYVNLSNQREIMKDYNPFNPEIVQYWINKYNRIDHGHTNSSIGSFVSTFMKYALTKDKEKDTKTLRVYVNFKNPGAPHYYIRPEAAYSLGLITYEKFAKYSIINDFHPLPYPILQETAKELEIEYVNLSNQREIMQDYNPFNPEIVQYWINKYNRIDYGHTKSSSGEEKADNNKKEDSKEDYIDKIKELVEKLSRDNIKNRLVNIYRDSDNNYIKAYVAYILGMIEPQNWQFFSPEEYIKVEETLINSLKDLNYNIKYLDIPFKNVDKKDIHNKSIEIYVSPIGINAPNYYIDILSAIDLGFINEKELEKGSKDRLIPLTDKNISYLIDMKFNLRYRNILDNNNVIDGYDPFDADNIIKFVEEYKNLTNRRLKKYKADLPPKKQGDLPPKILSDIKKDKRTIGIENYVPDSPPKKQGDLPPKISSDINNDKKIIGIENYVPDLPPKKQGDLSHPKDASKMEHLNELISKYNGSDGAPGGSFSDAYEDTFDDGYGNRFK